jgi:hypothetical protein
MITIEEYGAFTTSLFAGITLWLAWKTKSLTDVVVELKEQNKVLNKRYDLERLLSLRNRLPDFEVTDFARTANQTWRIEFTNFGQFATHFYTDNRSDGFKELLIGDYSKIAETKTLFLFAEMKEIFDDRNKINFEFDFWYKNGIGSLMKQHVTCLQGHINITPQTDSEVNIKV